MIQIGAYVISVTAFALLFVMRNRFPRNLMRIKWAVDAFLAFAGAAALVPTGLGQLLSGWISGALGWIFSDAAAAASIAVLVLVVIAVFGLLDKSADTPELTALVLLPFLAAVAAGPVAAAVSGVYEGGGQMASTGVGELVGG